MCGLPLLRHLVSVSSFNVCKFCAAQVIGVMDAMPSTNLKPEGENEALVSDRIYRTTYMFRCSCLPSFLLLSFFSCSY